MADSCFCSAEINTTLWSNYPPNKKKLKNKSILVCSVTKSCPTLCNPVDCSKPGFPVLHCLPEFAQTHVQLRWWCYLTNHLILCHPLLVLPSIFPSIRVFSNESALRIRWPKYRSFSFSISTSNEYSVLIYLRVDLFDLCAVQGTLNSLLQHHNSKASVLRLFYGSSLWSNSHICTWLPSLWSAFFMIQLSHPYMTTRKTIALTRQIFVSKVMFLLFNTLLGLS